MEAKLKIVLICLVCVSLLLTLCPVVVSDNSFPEDSWFYDVPMEDGYGHMTHTMVDYDRFWNDMPGFVKWRLWWNNGNTWVNVSNQFNIWLKMKNAGRYRFGLNFTPLQSGIHRLELTVGWDAVSWSYNSNTSEFMMTYRTHSGRLWNFNFSFYEIRNVGGLSFSYYMRNDGKLVFNITRNVPPLGVGRKISLDPYYGIMPATPFSNYEFDTVNGEQSCMVRMGSSEYYFVSYKGNNDDGFVQTLQVFDDNGTIRQRNISWYEFDTSDGSYTSCVNVPGTNFYAVSYRDTGGGKTTVITLEAWSTNGTIRQSVIDTQQLTYDGYYSHILQVTGSVYVVAHALVADNDGWIETFTIDAAGQISAVVDTQEYDTVYGWYPDLLMLDSDTLAIAYSTDGTDGYLSCWNISALGVITNTKASGWEFDAGHGETPCIKHIYNNIYAISYRQSLAGWIKTVEISTTGMITAVWIDTLNFDAACYYPNIFTVHDATFCNPGLYGIAYDGAAGDGWVVTMNITATGVISNSVIDSLEFDPGDNSYYCSVSWVNQSWYFVVYRGVGADGWSRTFNVSTNWAFPVVSNVFPVNNSVDVALAPLCDITISDMNGDTMNVYWTENSTGVWVSRQINSSCVNGTYRFVYTWATSYNTVYYWRVCVNDSMFSHNVSHVYHFTTLTEPPIIVLSDEYPVNNSVFVFSCQVDIGRNNTFTMNITHNETTVGAVMTTVVYFNGSYLFTNISVNDTLSFNLFEFWDGVLFDGVSYNWSVNCSSGDSFNNSTYFFVFETSCDAGVSIMISQDRFPLGLVVGIMCGVACGIVCLSMRKKKK